MVNRVLVLQSDKPPPRAAWRRACLASVRSWTAARGYEYLFLGDELFGLIPDNLRRACRGVVLPLTDIGRLLWLQKLLAEGWDRVIWLDADILIFDPALRIEAEAIGREVWICRGLKDGFRAAESVNNCVLSISAQSPLLGCLLDATLAEVATFNAPPHPRTLGPDLFRRLHKAQPLPVAPDVAMASPPMISGLSKGDPAALAAHHSIWNGPVRAANLCGSLIEDDDLALLAVQRLLKTPASFLPDALPPSVEVIRFA